MLVSRHPNKETILSLFCVKVFFILLLTQWSEAGSRKILNPNQAITTAPYPSTDEGSNRTIDCITSGIGSGLTSFLDKINSTLEDLPNMLVSKFNQANGTVSNISSLITSTLEFIPFYISLKINQTLQNIPKVITNKIDQVNSSVSSIPNMLSNKFGQANSTVGGLPDLLNSTLNFIPSLITSVTSLAEQFMNVLNNLLDSALNSQNMPSFLKGIVDKIKMTTGIGLDKPAGVGCNRVDKLLIGNIPGTFIGVPLVILGIYILVGAIAAVIVAIGGLGETITMKIYDDLDFANLGNHNDTRKVDESIVLQQISDSNRQWKWNSNSRSHDGRSVTHLRKRKSNWRFPSSLTSNFNNKYYSAQQTT